MSTPGSFKIQNPAFDQQQFKEQFGLFYEEPLALKQIRARQEDYWNKIAQYNYRIHQMEVKEKLDKKKKDQQDMRNMLAQQLQTKKDNRDSEMRKDKAMVDEANRLNELDKAKHAEKERQMRLKLQEINRERDQYIKERNEEE